MSRNITLIFILSISFLFFSCTSPSSSGAKRDGAATVDMSLYASQKVEGSTWQKVTRNHSSGELFEEGYVSNGVKVGTWTTYFPSEGYIQTVTSFDEGLFTGPFIEFDERGRLMKQANYINNVFDGLYGEFKNGRPIKKIMYSKGKINGFIREYNNKSKVIKESNYKDNVLDGKVSNYNDDGKLILEYIYKNGEKISGGIIE